MLNFLINDEPVNEEHRCILDNFVGLNAKNENFDFHTISNNFIPIKGCYREEIIFVYQSKNTIEISLGEFRDGHFDDYVMNHDEIIEKILYV